MINFANFKMFSVFLVKYLFARGCNPRSKNFIATLPDHLLVWGEESKIEAQEFLGMQKKILLYLVLHIILDKMMFGGYGF